jgi:hypothetical protein
MYVNYAFNLLSEGEFECLVVAICRKILGPAAHAFAKGPDGARDSSFEGTAQCYPSATSPWKGKMIIQAKHVDHPNYSCADSGFFEGKSSVINHEINRLNQIKKDTGETFDCYLIFTNRKLTGGIYPKIIDRLKNGLNIQYADIIGVEDLTNYVNQYKELIKEFRLLRNYLPDRFYEEDIKNVILLFNNSNKDWINTSPTVDEDFDFVEKTKKNKLNNISEAYFADIRDYSLMYFDAIDNFLKDPRNAELHLDYLNTVSDLQGYILQNRDSYPFEDILESIIKNIVGEKPQENIFHVRKLVRVFVHFMYWNCDIGRKK